MSFWLAFAGLVVAIIIGLGRQLTVFLVVDPAIRIFRRYKAKRNIGLVLVACFCGAALVIDWQGSDGVSTPVVTLSVAAAALGLFAVLFNLESLFPALDEVRVLDRQAVDAEAKADKDLAVVHVEIDDARRSYPLERMVMARHLVHDSLGGSPIVLTYCALCRSGIVYYASVAGRQLTFRVVGIFRRNLIMEDLQTRTLWQQATGRAIYGPLAGATLEMLSSEQTAWAAVRDKPGATLAVEPESAEHAPFAGERGFGLLKAATDRIITPGKTRLSRRLPPRETVFGIRIGSAARAYPLSEVESGGTFLDEVGGVTLEMRYIRETSSLTAHRLDGRPDPIIERHWWLGWNEFHPETTVYRASE